LFQDAEAIARKTDNTSITGFNIYHSFVCPGSNGDRFNHHHGINDCGNHDKHSLKELDFDKLTCVAFFGVADLGYELFYLQFLKPRLKLTFGYVQN
jgi:hypothetical protein